MIRNSDEILIGVVSFGVAGCTLKNFPVVFSKVSSVRSWINDITNI